MLSKSDIDYLIMCEREELQTLGYKVLSNGKALKYKSYNLRFLTSKYGHDPYFGLSFFLRAEKVDARKDGWGNIDPFEKNVQIDLTPRELKNMKNKTVPGSFKGLYFDAKDIVQLKQTILPLLNIMRDYLDKINDEK